MEEIINNKKYKFCVFKGIVLGSSKDSRTHVYGGYSTQYSYTPIRSSVSVHDILFLKDQNGQEHEIHVTNWDIGARDGHELLFVWTINSGGGSGPYLCIKNLNTGMTYTNKDEIKNMSRHSFLRLNLYITLPLVAPFFLLWLLLIAGFLGYGKDIFYAFKGITESGMCCFALIIVVAAIGMWIASVVQKMTFKQKVYSQVINIINSISSQLK